MERKHLMYFLSEISISKFLRGPSVGWRAYNIILRQKWTWTKCTAKDELRQMSECETTENKRAANRRLFFLFCFFFFTSYDLIQAAILDFNAFYASQKIT